jgi:hypothetical protein
VPVSSLKQGNAPFNPLVHDYFHCTALPCAEGTIVSKIKLFRQSKNKLFIFQEFL